MANEPTAPVKRAWLYYRVSTGHVEQDSSLEVQQAVCRAFCERQGWEIVGESQDRKTGTKLTRKGFKEAAAAIADGRADVLIAKHLSRFARTTEFSQFLRDEIHLHGKDMITVEGNFDTRTAAGRFQLTVLLASFQFTVEQQGEQVKLGKRIRREQGYWPCMPPYGAMPSEDRAIPIKNPDEWPHLLWLFEQAAAGMPYLQIASLARERGIPSRHGGAWTDQTVRRILTNDFWVAPELRHDCKVDAELWKQAQPRHARGRRPVSTSPYLLRGKVHNGYFIVTKPEHSAGEFAPMGRCPAHGEARYVIRSQYQRVHWEAEPVPDCPGIPMTACKADWLDGVVVARVIQKAEETGAEGLFTRVMSALAQAEEELRRQLKAGDRRLTEARKGVADAERRLMRALDNELDTLLPELQQALKDRRDELKAVEAARSTIINRLSELALTDPAESARLVNSAAELWKHQRWDELRKLLNLLISRVIVRLYRVPGKRDKEADVEIEWRDVAYLADLASLNLPVLRPGTTRRGAPG